MVRPVCWMNCRVNGASVEYTCVQLFPAATYVGTLPSAKDQNQRLQRLLFAASKPFADMPLTLGPELITSGLSQNGVCT